MLSADDCLLGVSEGPDVLFLERFSVEGQRATNFITGTGNVSDESSSVLLPGSLLLSWALSRFRVGTDCFFDGVASEVGRMIGGEDNGRLSVADITWRCPGEFDEKSGGTAGDFDFEGVANGGTLAASGVIGSVYRRACPIDGDESVWANVRSRPGTIRGYLLSKHVEIL